MRALAPVMGVERAFDRVSTVFYVLAIAGMLWSLFAWLRIWFPDDLALVPPLIASCTMRITMRQHDYAPYSFLEPTFFALALIAIVRRKDIWFGVLVALASFNRETAIFLVPLYLVTSDWSRRAWITTAIYGAIWAAIFTGVRAVSGEAERYWTIERVFRTNIAQPGLALAQLTMVLGAFWGFAALGWRRAPELIKRASLIVPAYLATVAIWGIWWEVRLLMPMYPLIFALALAYLEKIEWRRWAVAAVLATAVAVNAFDYSVLVPQPQLRYEMHQAIVDGTAPLPQRFQVLVPWLVDPIITAASTWMAPDQAFRRVYFAFHFIALAALLAGVYGYARLWFSRTQSMVGALIAGSVLHLPLRMGEYWDFSPIPMHTWFAPWALLDAALIAFAVIAVHRRHWVTASAIAVCIMLNSAGGLLLGIGAIGLTLADNLRQLPSAAINLGLFLGPVVLLAVSGFRRAPRFARRAVLMPLPLLACFALFADWRNVLLLTPLYALTAPLVLTSTFGSRD